MESILIIDDEKDVLNAISETLESEGYSTIKANSKEAGIQNALTHLPDLIICDLRMPDGAEGFEVLKEIRENKSTSDIPFIFLTMVDDSENIVTGFKLGAQDYISKSATPEEILIRAKTQLDLRKKNRLLVDTNMLLEEYRNFASEKLRDKLQIILGKTELLSRKFTETNDPETIKTLEKINHNCNEILEMVERYLEK